MSIESIFLSVSIVLFIFSALFWIRPWTVIKLQKRKKELVEKFRDLYCLENSWYKKQSKSSESYRNFLFLEYPDASIYALSLQNHTMIERSLERKRGFQDSVQKNINKIHYPITNFFVLRLDVLIIESGIEKIKEEDIFLESLFDEIEDLIVELEELKEDFNIKKDDESYLH
ncbi:MAG: hypothetical protein L3J07_03215 [Candidatus Magasanikbacteria bacterium]|nr:hypothetical protein [Candidatus Magasanikbacteria bacterium]